MKIKALLLTAIVIYLIPLSCKETKPKTEADLQEVETEIKEEQSPPTLTNDTTELKNLTQELYKWHETQSTHVDFSPSQIEETDTVYAGIDLEHHRQRMEELKKSDLFAKEFLENYNQIALSIDERLKNNTLEWYIGDLPPFGNNANPWCNCQDNPDNYWEDITILDLTINGDVATYSWTWGNGFEYKVKAVKENGSWKILYLQGFDFKEFIPTNN